MAGFTAFRTLLVSGTAFAALAVTPAAAQTSDQSTAEAATPTGAAVPVSDADQEDGRDRGGREQEVLITGSRIRQNPNNSALPLQIITNQEISRNGISSPEQLIMFLSTNGTGADNLASNADVTSGAQRGTNGLSAANLRGQGSAATLVLLNGRRVAAHGLTGGAVDVNQIPFAAIERVEVLKDGASAIYGTDAVGGVINFITRKDYQGLGLQGFTDVTEAGGGNIYRLSGIAGYGDLDKDGFNVMGAVAYSWNRALRGEDRPFVNGYQPERGLTIDTRGTPIATAFNIGANTRPNSITQNGTLLTGLTLTAPNNANAAAGGINILDLPGGAGCESMDGGLPYDEVLWNAPTAYYACAWDTGRAAVLQQPINTLTYYGRGVVNLGEGHQMSLEVTGSDATSAKRFSNAQLTANTTNLAIAYPLNSMTATTYNSVFNAIRAAFPAQAAALDGRYGRPIAYRWRCIACGTREYVTETKTFRAAFGVEGPMFGVGDWDYRAGASYAKSESASVLGTGYYYRGTLGNGDFDPNAPAVAGAALINGQVPRGLVGLMNSGLINPFSTTQTAEGLAALESVSAYGATLYGGQYEVKQFDVSISGSLFPVWGGDVQMAAGLDVRKETYSFNGSDAAAATAPVIFLAAFDNVNALTPKNRTVKAAYAEVLVPLFPGFEITGAVRIDDYTLFGSTTNPKVSVKYRPIEQIMFRGSYNTGFRVPSFNQIFNGVTLSPYSGSDLADPVACPGGVPNLTNPACAFIRPEIATGGNRELGPETAKQFSVGVVIQPARLFSASVDFWSIAVDNTIQTLTLRQLIENAALFPERFFRPGGAGTPIEIIDQRWINAGSRRTQGLEVSLRGGVEFSENSRIMAGLDGTLLLKKREKLTPTAQYGPSLIGVFSFAGDLGVRWKHNAFISYSNDDISLSLSQLFRKGYRNGALPGIASGAITRPEYNAFVKDYIIYNLSASYTGLSPNYKLTMGVRNLFDTDPPFAITYDGNTGAGGSWEPRVADPRGRSFTVGVEVKF
ncbi:iron complex outermembrane receptor protein [Sphingomonas naasensis]|uniref:TonB-dependent receptor n=1 Tax=Sphingomonas naasensis TaxID=1344951 RepID=A0A4S1WCU2_9SPHN|nr:TonB-dependent receptor [Sphingomonas naasensis]NIJ22223.1 iron complex outermembrane receptor protein [Sphingomonas naasensis]TGX40758.1 TonB-dependent receptor [Sphingomonas naasensis]